MLWWSNVYTGVVIGLSPSLRDDVYACHGSKLLFVGVFGVLRYVM